jgi:prepilin-type N-terminal cleavage/methylation domain-containing protein
LRAGLARRRGQGGFTLIELTISLVAGLIVAMAVVGVSKEATNTFHEEVRVSAAEMGLRVAMERIRLDLQRAAYMGTPALLGDPNVTHIVNAPAPANLSNFTGATVPYNLQNLAGVNVYPQGNAPSGAIVPSTVVLDLTANTQLGLQASGSGTLPPTLPTMATLAPDAIDIAGNMSSSDEYPTGVVWGPPWGPPIPGVPAGCATTVALSLQMTSPSGWRIRNAETLGSANAGWVNGTALQAIFHPGQNTGSSFFLKVTDSAGNTQYVVGCPGQLNAAVYTPPGASVTALPVAMLYLAPGSTLIASQQTGGHGGISGLSPGLITVSPLQVTRWSIQSPAQVTLAAAAVGSTNTYFYNQTATATSDPTDFLLTRSYVDVSANCGSTATPCPVDPFTTEIIAEYAVDLKFGLTVDSFPNPQCQGVTAFPCPTAAPVYTGFALTNIPMDSAPTAFKPYGAVEGTYNPSAGPQRIRDVQVRIGIRSPFGDRAASLPVPPETAIPNGYLYRYLLNASASHYTPAAPYARVREATTEVNLPNQSRVYW